MAFIISKNFLFFFFPSNCYAPHIGTEASSRAETCKEEVLPKYDIIWGVFKCQGIASKMWGPSLIDWGTMSKVLCRGEKEKHLSITNFRDLLAKIFSISLEMIDVMSLPCVNLESVELIAHPPRKRLVEAYERRLAPLDDFTCHASSGALCL